MVFDGEKTAELTSKIIIGAFLTAGVLFGLDSIFDLGLRQYLRPQNPNKPVVSIEKKVEPCTFKHCCTRGNSIEANMMGQHRYIRMKIEDKEYDVKYDQREGTFCLYNFTPKEASGIKDAQVLKDALDFKLANYSTDYNQSRNALRHNDASF